MDLVDRLVGEPSPLGERDADQVELGLDVAGADAEDRPPTRAARRWSRNAFAVASGWRYAGTYTWLSSFVRSVTPASQPSVAIVFVPGGVHRGGLVARDGNVVAHRDVVEAAVVARPAAIAASSVRPAAGSHGSTK